MCNIARAGNDDALVLERLTARLEHLLSKIHGTVTSGFGADQGPPPGKAFAGKYPGKFVPDFLVHPEKVSDFAGTYPDIAGRHVGIGADMPAQFGHESVAKAHHLIVRFAFRVEIGPPFAAAHGQRGEAVLENLLKGQEFEDAGINRRVEAQTALIRAYGRIHLDAVSAVYVNFPPVVYPGHAKGDKPLGLRHAKQDVFPAVDFVLGDVRDHRFSHFLHSLEKFGFVAVSDLDLFHESRNFLLDI